VESEVDEISISPDEIAPDISPRDHPRSTVFHVLFAIDRDGDNVRLVTAYRPDPEEWEPPDFRNRRKR